MADVITLGELLIDFVSTVSGVTLAEAPAFQKAPGGAPANVAVGLRRQGIRSAFLGKVGDDPFGHFLAGVLAADGVDISGLRYSTQARTTLAFVSLRADGEREFMFYRHPSADMLYRPDEVDVELVRAARILHFGSISLIGEPSRSATLHAVALARQAGRMVSYDPNLRLSLWPDAEAARQGMLIGWPHAQVIKVSEEELSFLLSGSQETYPGEAEIEAAARRLWHPELKLLLVSRGRLGCTLVTPGGRVSVPSFRVEQVETTGAGDAFMAGVLAGLVHNPQALDDEAQLVTIARRANAAGALTTTRRGAIPALPTTEELERFLAQAG